VSPPDGTAPLGRDAAGAAPNPTLASRLWAEVMALLA